MSYRVILSTTAQKELEALQDADVKRVRKKVLELAENPRPPGCRKLKGYDNRCWRVRAGDYRILYEIEDVLSIVDIWRIRNRRDVYDR